MGYRILIIDQNKTEYSGEYSSLAKLIEAQSNILDSLGHQVNVILNLEEITKQAYSNQDCILAHPTLEKLKRIMELHNAYPNVGLIITTGPGYEENQFHQLTTDSDGIYFLTKPYMAETLLSVIDKVVAESLKISKKL